MAISLVGTPIRNSYASTSSPQTGNVASSGVLQANDLVVVGIRGSDSAATLTTPANWLNALGGNTTAPSPDHVNAMIVHVVTAAEVTADTRAWTFTSFWNAANSGACYTICLRGVDPLAPIDAAAAAQGAATTTHVLAGIPSTDITYSGGEVVSFVSGPSTQTYATDPTGWTSRAKNAGGVNTGNILTRDTLTTAGVAVAATNITASSSISYSSITAAFKDAAAVLASSGTFFALF